ncbi:glycosyltransferase-like domain-containing protein 1-like [Teleopsis dalmanni]|uniref:glycosyltransferase-like domain-containing protein 1-like n=1 Tax=Teleopsis dalmanni TaxID=139649 RepID=UPI0018CCFCD0|nr:glycosyltransferase-like domain-containing protein 1-like [Teleopsis dalmanni]XP_037937198.1 glycosyltransferase-like domain-containing protein 1-like [Teleopsis dalmanni]XP_037937361.1 glycosyltransferase-like domain-containing protein 1-like [Teleopsis dalmanni]XP_037937362.1 glycosyltransferase-like domain-containing protein 1-like [Teleopsis dalmanni]
MSKPSILIIEPFFGGSHKQLIETLTECLSVPEYDLFTLPAKKWHWRARTSALYFSQIIPTDHMYRVLFTSSVINLAELIGTRPDLGDCRKLVYFHENQLVYPVRDVKERDVQYGLNQILTCLAADCCIFNSNFNRTSFLDNIQSFLSIQPDLKLKNLRDKIEKKCEVIYYPIKFHSFPNKRFMIGGKMTLPTMENDKDCLHIIWPHRWEHDKNPKLLVEVLLELNKRKVEFKVTICGETYNAMPEAFEGIQEKLGTKLVNFGYLSKENYVKALMAGDVVVSTAGHEFYGVAMLEATYCGCMPIAPNKLVYPEIYPSENLYNTSNQLIKMLYNWCRNPDVFRRQRDKFFEYFTFDIYSAQRLVPKYLEKLRI